MTKRNSFYPKFLSASLLGILFLLLCLPLIQTNWSTVSTAIHPRLASLLSLVTDKWGFIPKTTLERTPLPRPPISLKLKTFSDGSFQRRFEDYFMRGTTLWPWLVRISNQLVFSLFNQITLSYGPPAFIGKEGQFLQAMYLKAFNRHNSLKKKQYFKRVSKLKRLETLLAERGVKLLITISPNAVSLYPELLPASYQDPSRLSRKNGYDYMLPAFIEKKLQFVDNFSLLNNIKNEFSFRLFEKGGAHWNSVGSCLATNNLLNKLAFLTNKKLPYIPCTPITYKMPQGDDADLIKVSNLLFPEHYQVPAPYIPKAEKLLKKPALKLLIVGTSFNFAILDHLNNFNLADTTFYFYYHSLYKKINEVHTLDKTKIDWENDIFKRDVIILEANYSNLGSVGLNFVNDALCKLRKDKLKALSLEQQKAFRKKKKNRKRQQKLLGKSAHTNRTQHDDEFNH